MIRKVLLLEPNYKNKYPPMGLMKLATYFRNRGDYLRFFKGDLNDFAVEVLFEEFWKKAFNISLGEYTGLMRQYIKTGKVALLNNISNFVSVNGLHNMRARYKASDFPTFDIVSVTTLFTFYWKETIETINTSKKFVANNGKILIGGISSSIMSERLLKDIGVLSYKKLPNEKETKKIIGQTKLGSKNINVHLYIGLLDEKGIIDKDSKVIIDELPLDYSILDEISYAYPVNNSYFGNMTRGCVRKCPFCAVPKLETKFIPFISIRKQIQQTKERFGEQKNLILLDNNVLASRDFSIIIDEIKKCGFEKNAMYKQDNIYEIAIKNIKNKYNAKTYVKKMIKFYDDIADKLSEKDQGNFYNEREEHGLLYVDTATTKEVLSFNKIAEPLYKEHIYSKIKVSKGQQRHVDFNQGVDARLITEAKIKKLAEIKIQPLRIAFDTWADIPKGKKQPMYEIYTESIKLAAKYGIHELSNYLLYNTDNDTPDELFFRLRLNVNLCEELGVNIFSFPMKYHPIDDPDYFDNRNFIGKSWNRKFIRAIQAVLNSTHGKIGRGKSFFEAAFGKSIDQFYEILVMPEVFIIERYKYDKEAYKLYLKNGGLKRVSPENIRRYGNKTNEWRIKYKALNQKQRIQANTIIFNNIFTDETIGLVDTEVKKMLKYYRIKR
jgi:hypothetical protein